MKHLKKFDNVNDLNIYKQSEEYILPNVSLVDNEIANYDDNIKLSLKYTLTKSPHYNLLDILYSNELGDKKVTSEILDPSLGYIPIGLCIVETEFFGIGEPARYISLKIMSYNSPDTGTTNSNWSKTTGSYMNFGNINAVNNQFDIISSYKDNDELCYLSTSYQTHTSPLSPSLFDENNNWNLIELGEINKYALTDIDGKNKTHNILLNNTNQLDYQTDETIVNSTNDGYVTAALCCARYHTLGTDIGDWYLGSCGELALAIVLRDDINSKLKEISQLYPDYCCNKLPDSTIWTSSLYKKSSKYMWALNNSPNEGRLLPAPVSDSKAVIAMYNLH